MSKKRKKHVEMLKAEIKSDRKRLKEEAKVARRQIRKRLKGEDRRHALQALKAAIEGQRQIQKAVLHAAKAGMAVGELLRLAQEGADLDEALAAQLRAEAAVDEVLNSALAGPGRGGGYFH